MNLEPETPITHNDPDPVVELDAATEVSAVEPETAKPVSPSETDEAKAARREAQTARRRAQGVQPLRLAPCGTPAAYRRHLRNSEPVDEACRTRWNADEKARRVARKAQREAERLAAQAETAPSDAEQAQPQVDVEPQPEPQEVQPEPQVDPLRSIVVSGGGTFGYRVINTNDGDEPTEP